LGGLLTEVKFYDRAFRSAGNDRLIVFPVYVRATKMSLVLSGEAELVAIHQPSDVCEIKLSSLIDVKFYTV
jgi:hypothetical protein